LLELFKKKGGDLRFSDSLIPTTREDPSDAELISHKLLVRAGYIRKLAAGIYTYLPLGLRVIKKIEDIIRVEMAAAGATELLLPIVIPAELWKESGRWDVYGKELLRFKDRGEREFCIGPTHEEVITDLIRREVKSYRDLPKNLFQIQTKFRDEIRPRFGLMRGREFLMKDGYSFDVSEEMALQTYKRMYDAYTNIFKKCGLDFKAVEAATGTIGGTYSHEFHAIASSGEDTIFHCSKCEYAASHERALTVKKRLLDEANELLKATPPSEGSFEYVETPNVKSVKDVSSFLKVSESDIVKTLIYKLVLPSEKEQYIAALISGDDELVEPKLILSLFQAGIIPSMDVQISMASEDEIIKLTGAPAGFSGPIGLPDEVVVVADYRIYLKDKFVTGGNKKDMHLKSVSWQNCRIQLFADIRKARDGDECPVVSVGADGNEIPCDGKLIEKRGIEVGQVFYLGTKYSDKMNAVFLDEKGTQQKMVMGCYGIGVGRTAAAIVEQCHDDKGIVWPLAVAPFECHLIALYDKEGHVEYMANDIYLGMLEANIDVLYDNRYVRPGVKFVDADLIGIPYQVIVSAKSIEDGMVDLKERATGKMERMDVQDAINKIAEAIKCLQEQF